MKNLSGQRNQCPTCGEYFNSNIAFEKHRIGEFGIDRRCATVEEMLSFKKPMAKNNAGFWVTALNPVFQTEDSE